MTNFKKALGFSAAGLIMLAMHEGYSPKPYKDTGGVVTNGFGNATLSPNRTVTVVEALTDLQTNTQKTGEGISKCITAELTQGQYDAYVSFAYNVGVDRFCKSTMAKLANQGDKVGSCNQLDRWMFVAGKDCRIASSNCRGIAKRRAEEKALCLS